MAHDEDDIIYWQCPNCGQVHFGSPPPEICDFCQDLTTWRPLLLDHHDIPFRVDSSSPDDDGSQSDDDEPPKTQLPLFDE